MRFREFLVERVLNLKTPEERRPFAKVVWDMLQRSYAKIGGFKSVANVEELINEPGYWKLVRRNNKIVAVNIYKLSPKTKTFKVIASATETEYNPEKQGYVATNAGRADYNMMKDADIKMKRAWAEVSGPAEKLMVRAGAKMIPNKFAKHLTGKEILALNPDGFHYTRLIHGQPHEKVICGFAKLAPKTKAEIEASGIDLKTLPDNMA